MNTDQHHPTPRLLFISIPDDSCFRARSNKIVASRHGHVRVPFINVGMPKMGSTSLHKVSDNKITTKTKAHRSTAVFYMITTLAKLYLTVLLLWKLHLLALGMWQRQGFVCRLHENSCAQRLPSFEIMWCVSILHANG